ncbi:MAG TPA: lipopolysaccharide kinase InaA family protein, partial [Gemmataceae bacterium]|nr:lipopolysaccharide kinase InaA family protein [Gemmataceae bacterium]
MVDPTPYLDPMIRWQVVPEFRDTLLGPNGLRLDEWLQNGQARMVKHGAHRTVYHVVLPKLSFYLKHYPLPDLRAWLRQLVRPSKGRSEFDHALEIARRGVPTFTPLAFGEKQARFGPGASFLITRTLENTQSLNTFLEETWPALSSRRRIRLGPRLATALGNLLARMHDFGVWHFDLHAGNLLIRLDPDDQPELFLIDVYSVTLRQRLDWATSCDNLIMLNRWFSLRVNRSERLRFWHAYC